MSKVIFAPATVQGISALSIIRLSGKGADEILKKITRRSLPNQRELSLRTFYQNETSTNIIDKCMVSWMPAPKSYTGEDSVEIYCHGSPAVMRAFFDCFKRFKNLRLAKEGEFTKTALMNGKLNLIEAEAINDLIISETEEQRKLALQQMQGRLVLHVKKWKGTLINCMALIESNIDFSDEQDIPETLNVDADLKKLKSWLKRALNNSKGVQLIKEGTKIVLTGKTNVGKSSIFNRIIKQQKAIVANIPGTTRDVLEAHLNIKGFPILLFDTAGLSNSKNPIEVEGIKKAKKLIKNADIVLNVLDATVDKVGKSRKSKNNNHWFLLNKIDLIKNEKKEKSKQEKILFVSAKTGTGIQKVLESIESFIIHKTESLIQTSVFVSSIRQKIELEEALTQINQAIKENKIEIKAEYLREASNKLSRVMGEIDVEDVLGDIFSNFCIGK